MTASWNRDRLNGLKKAWHEARAALDAHLDLHRAHDPEDGERAGTHLEQRDADWLRTLDVLDGDEGRARDAYFDYLRSPD
jgi:DNA-binding LacI/PurR family transcriptional regulator